MGMTVLRKGGSTPVASDDRILFDKIFDAAGIIVGGGATMSAVNKIHVPETTAWIKGTEIKIDDQDVTVGLSDSGTKYGRVILVLDWSTEETAHFEYEIAASASAFRELIQDEDINFSAGIWEEVFATYTCTEASISNVAFCMSTLQDASGGSLIAGSESGTLSTQPYVAGQYLIWNGKLKKATAPIAIGDVLAVGTNLSADTTVGNELYALNSSLTASDNLKFRFATDGEGNYGYLDGDDAFVPFSSLENAKIWVMWAYSGYIYGGNPHTGASEGFTGSTGKGTYTFGDLTLTWSSGGILTTNKRMLYMGRTSSSDGHYITKIIEPNTPTYAAPVYQSTSMALLELEPVTPP